MKIIQSFWSLPSQDSNTVSNRINSGWLDESYNLLSWTFSCLKFREFYNQVELTTDLYGKEILIDRLRLPYTAISTELENIRGVNPNLWSFGKIYTYSLQKQPFIHADGDIYLWGRFPGRIHRAELVAQHLEDYPYYEKFLKELYKYASILPVEFRAPGNFHAVNAGIMGGRDYAFFQKFFLKVIDFVAKNEKLLVEFHSSKLNILVEQFYLFQVASGLGKKFDFLFANVSANFMECLRFNLIPHKEKFIHTIGTAKKDIVICKQIENLLKYEYPEHYIKIRMLLNNSYHIKNESNLRNKSLLIWNEEERKYYSNLVKWRTFASNQLYNIKFVLNKSVKTYNYQEKVVIQYKCPYTLTSNTITLCDFDKTIIYFDTPMSANDFVELFEEYDSWSISERIAFKDQILNRLTIYMFYYNIIEIFKK